MEYKFKAEVKQVLDLVVNSLYTDKEIFVRELISNASDASSKLRIQKLSQTQKINDDELKIKVSTDEKAGTFTIEDHGIGMNAAELASNLGTIAHSGSKAFVEALKKSKGELIGQFGVGFYSVFMVAKKVDVFTKSETDEASHWSCDGSENFTIETCDKSERGTKIVATLKDECMEFSKKDRIYAIAERYGAYIDFPLFINEQKIETRQAVWLKSRSDLKPEQYEDFYKFQTHAFDKPLDWLHFKSDVPIELNALIYTPSENTERLGFGKSECEVALYCKKVLIDPKPKMLFPEWMRFAKGVIDSSDIPLNISRESMQDSGLCMKIGRVVLKRFLKHLSEMSKKDGKKFSEFTKRFGSFIKEGAATDLEYRKDLTELLRFESSLHADGTLASLSDYVGRMKPNQKHIFYACAQDRATIEASPYLEAFTKRGLEVLFMYEPIDTFLLGNLSTYQEKPFTSIDAADIELDDIPEDPKNSSSIIPTEELAELKLWVKETLGDAKVSDVLSDGKRLWESPAAVLNADSLTPQMRAMLKAMNPDSKLPPAVVKFEINPRSEVIKNLNSLRKSDSSLAKLVLDQLFDNALLSAGLLENPRLMIKRMNEILSKIKV